MNAAAIALSSTLSLPGSQIAFNSSQINFSHGSVGGVSAHSTDPRTAGQTHTSAQTKLGGRRKQCVDLSNRPLGHKFVLHSHSDTLLTRRIGSRRSTPILRPPRRRAPLARPDRERDAPAAFHLVYVTRDNAIFFWRVSQRYALVRSRGECGKRLGPIVPNANIIAGCDAQLLLLQSLCLWAKLRCGFEFERNFPPAFSA